MQPDLLQWYSGIWHLFDLNMKTNLLQQHFVFWMIMMALKKYWGFTPRAKTSKTVSSPTNRSTSFHRGIFPHATAVYSLKSEKHKPAVTLICSRRSNWAAAALDPPQTVVSCTRSKAGARSQNTNLSLVSQSVTVTRESEPFHCHKRMTLYLPCFAQLPYVAAWASESQVLYR